MKIFFDELLKWIHNKQECLDSVAGSNKEKGAKIIWFGVSERGFKLKTTLHGEILKSMVNNVVLFSWLVTSNHDILKQLEWQIWVNFSTCRI